MSDDESADVAAKKVGRDPQAKSVRAAAKHLSAFHAAHGGAGSTFVEYVSSTRTRIVVVAEDGTWGDAVLAGVNAARAAVDRAGLTITEDWDRESSGSVRSSSTDWKRMAGST